MGPHRAHKVPQNLYSELQKPQKWAAAVRTSCAFGSQFLLPLFPKKGHIQKYLEKRCQHKFRRQKNYQSNFAPNQQICMRRELCQRIFKQKSPQTPCMNPESSRRDGYFEYWFSQTRSSPSHHKRLSPHINLSFFPHL